MKNIAPQNESELEQRLAAIAGLRIKDIAAPLEIPVPENLQQIARIAPACAGIRRWGAAALDLAHDARALPRTTRLLLPALCHPYTPAKDQVACHRQDACHGDDSTQKRSAHKQLHGLSVGNGHDFCP